MNFSLYKTRYKKYLFLSLLSLSLVIGFSRCVPIEDLLDPSIGEFTLQEQYNVTETIFLDVVLFDNFGIDTVQIDIKPIGFNSSFDTTIILSNDSIKARSLNLQQFAVTNIPSTAILGSYELTLTVIDVSGRRAITNISKRFVVEGDVSEPDFNFPDVILPEINGTSQTPACQLQALIVIGKAIDNVGLKEIRAQLLNERGDSTYFTLRREFSPIREDSVDLAALFGNDLRIPSTVPNGNIILRLIAIDETGNERVIDYTLLVDCDRILPVINSITTTPTLNTSNSTVEVIEGQELFITDGLITDINGLVRSISVYFNGSNTPFKTWSVNNESVKMDTLLDMPLLIPIPSNAANQDTYTFKIEATDLANNKATKEFIIDIIPNQPPNLLELRFALASNFNDVIEFSSNPNAPVSISPDTPYRLINRITDDLLLESYEVNWGIQDQTPITTQGRDNLNTLAVFFSSEQEDFTFSTEENSRIGTRYTLSIYARDILGLESQITYYFIVQ
ncbi:MAG: hypothetical protein COZ18_16390 [Flexibacter sp. CG_4_10_14_3_um_filter_32_15]|nr:MAG: hypothetical protein COZ18_16390 [Flexibacter sp. CG_4_10_14_3_um_filter_32_15]